MADAKGQWKITLPPMQAGGPHGMTIGDHLTMGNVMVGEVWLCAGQSNMEKPVGLHPGQAPCLNWRQEIAAADYPQIRLLEVPPTPANQPAFDCPCKWLPCSPQTIVIQRGGGHGYSACAYFFGRKLYKELKVPIGLIAASVSGTRCEPWTPGQAAGRESPVWYNGMIALLMPLAMRGVIWYQGESNMGDGMTYCPKMRKLITGWRQAWGRGDFPFYFVQLPNYRCGADSLARLREAQAATLGAAQHGHGRHDRHRRLSGLPLPQQAGRGQPSGPLGLGQGLWPHRPRLLGSALQVDASRRRQDPHPLRSHRQRADDAATVPAS